MSKYSIEFTHRAIPLNVDNTEVLTKDSIRYVNPNTLLYTMIYKITIHLQLRRSMTSKLKYYNISLI